MGLTDKLADGRRKKLAEFLQPTLEAGEEIETTLPMMQTYVGDFAGYYGVAVTGRRVLLVQWGRGIPETPQSVVGEQPRSEVVVEEHKPGLLMGKLVISHAGERWIGLKVPRLHREDAEAVVAALSQ